jgi:hypothetical protein
MTELEVFKQSLDVSRATLIVSLVVSLTTIVFASLQMAFQRSHDIKSMRPLCDFDKITEGGRVLLRAQNAGLGPLIVTGASIEAPGARGAEDPEPRDAPGLPAGLVIAPLERKVVASLEKAEWASLLESEFVLRYRDVYDRKREARIEFVSIPEAAV